MGHPLRIEDKDTIFFLTNRTAGSRLWFINNEKLEYLILAYLAKYQEKYGVTLYSFKLMGNHYHMQASFPNCNKACFMRSFNSIVAKLVARYVKEYDLGRLWARRYSEQVHPRSEDVEHWFYYISLNSMLAGLSSNLKNEQGYNSFSDAVARRARKFKLFEAGAFREAQRRDSGTKQRDYIKSYKLRFSRLPSYEHLSAQEYGSQIRSSFNQKLKEVVQLRSDQGKGFVPLEKLLAQRAGAKPRFTKTSKRYSFRPLVLTLCRESKKAFLEKYFYVLNQFKEASALFRDGQITAQFPQGTYRPYLFSN